MTSATFFMQSNDHNILRLVWGSVVQHCGPVSVFTLHWNQKTSAEKWWMSTLNTPQPLWLHFKEATGYISGILFAPPDYLTSACVNSTVHPLFVRGQTIVGSQIGKICITGNKMDTKQATVNFNIFVQIRWAGKLVITIITRSLIICER